MKISLDQQNTDNVHIEIVPLIDVIFCILIFFILAALQLTRQQAIGVDLPSAGTSTLQNQQTLMVSVDALGKVYVDRTEVSESQLYLILEGYRRTNPAGLMLLYADRNAIYNDVISILDLMRSVGGNRVALATLSSVLDAKATSPGTPQTDPLLPGLQPLEQIPLFPGSTSPDGQNLENQNLENQNLENQNLNLQFPTADPTSLDPATTIPNLENPDAGNPEVPAEDP